MVILHLKINFMSPKWFSLTSLLKTFTVTIVLIGLINFSCKKFPGKLEGDPLRNAIKGMDTTQNLWASWNVLLKPGTGYDARSATVLSIENYLRNEFYRIFPYNFTIRFQVFYCPCDSLLYNIGAKGIDGSGQSVTTPPPPPPPGGSGDALFVSNNNQVIEPKDSIPIRDTSFKMILSDPVRQTEIDTQILTIIDTGLDPRYFSSEIRHLIWAGDGSSTIYNVVDPMSNSYFDDHPEKHGTIVTAVALKALKDQNVSFGSPINHLSQLMILKALDSKKQGSTFSVSCALSYAVQRHAAMINASLGYYETHGDVDSVLRHYVSLCNTRDKPITIIAAAGNVPPPPPYTPGIICYPGTSNLNAHRMFYPACFSTDFNNLFSVTTLTNTHASCFYQNYSEQYVSIGVIQTGHAGCCYFSVPFAEANGSSFATPVIAGTGLSYVLNGQTVNNYMSSVTRESALPLVTKEGKYFNYTSN
jgi:hypothetical protein